MPELDAVDRKIIDKLQGDFPLCDEPYAAAAFQLGISGDELLERLQRLLDTRVLTRFGPMVHIERMGGADRQRSHLSVGPQNSRGCQEDHQPARQVGHQQR